MREVESFGIIPLRKEGGQWQVLMVCHRKGGHWAFPKGRAEEGEFPQESAVRELREETGLEVVQLLRSEPFVERYVYSHGKEAVQKRVTYFAALVKGTLHLQTEEVAEARWYSLSAAEDILTFPEARHLHQQVVDFIAGLANGSI